MLLTQCSHLFRKVCSKLAKEVATGQEVKGGVAPHGVKGEWVHGAGKLGHVMQLMLPVGCHYEKCCSWLRWLLRITGSFSSLVVVRGLKRVLKGHSTCLSCWSHGTKTWGDPDSARKKGSERWVRYQNQNLPVIKATYDTTEKQSAGIKVKKMTEHGRKGWQSGDTEGEQHFPPALCLSSK